MQFIEKFGTEDFMKVILISCIISVNFFLQINESSDVDGLALTKFFVRHSYMDSFQEDLLLFKSLNIPQQDLNFFNYYANIPQSATSHGIPVLIYAQMDQMC